MGFGGLLGVGREGLRSVLIRLLSVLNLSGVVCDWLGMCLGGTGGLV